MDKNKYHTTIHGILMDLRKADFTEWEETLKSEPLTADLYELLEDVPQGLYWHPEYDVTKHVFLVFKGICQIGNLELLEAAFCHDLGKKTCTTVGRDRIYAFGHAHESARIIESIKNRLQHYDLTYRVVKKHMDYNSAGHDKIKNDMYMKDFIKADKIMSTQLYYEYFFAFDDEENKRKEAKVLSDQQNSEKRVIIPIGTSGSGKSTYIEQHYPHEVVVCPDQIRKELTGDISDQTQNKKVWALTKQRMLENVQKYGQAVLDATNVNKYQRVQFMAAFNGCKKIAIVFNVDVEEACARVEKDIGEGKDRSNVPPNVVRKQGNNFHAGLSSIEHEFNEVIIVE